MHWLIINSLPDVFQQKVFQFRVQITCDFFIYPQHLVLIADNAELGGGNAFRAFNDTLCTEVFILHQFTEFTAFKVVAGNRIKQGSSSERFNVQGHIGGTAKHVHTAGKRHHRNRCFR